jgi:hypothetical protein
MFEPLPEPAAKIAAEQAKSPYVIGISPERIGKFGNLWSVATPKSGAYRGLNQPNAILQAALRELKQLNADAGNVDSWRPLDRVAAYEKLAQIARKLEALGLDPFMAAAFGNLASALLHSDPGAEAALADDAVFHNINLMTIQQVYAAGYQNRTSFWYPTRESLRGWSKELDKLAARYGV